MRTATVLGIHLVPSKNDLITFSRESNDLRILGSSISVTAPKRERLSLLSISLPEDKNPILLFVDVNEHVKGMETFILIEYKEQDGWWASMSKLPSFPYEMFVQNENITVKTANGKVVSTGNKPGTYQVTHDAMCQFLVGDINETELLAEAEKLAEETSRLKYLQQEVNNLQETIRSNRAELSNLRAEKSILIADLCEVVGVVSNLDKIVKEKRWSFDRVERIAHTLQSLLEKFEIKG